MPRLTVYTTDWCGYCTRAKHLLEQRGLAYDEVNLDHDPAMRDRVFELGGRMTVPLIMLGDTPLGGYNELAALDRSGELERLVATA